MFRALPAAFAALWIGASATVAAAAPTEDPTDEAPAMSLPEPVARCERQQPNARYRITLRSQAELGDLVDWMMSVSCQKFIWDPALRSGKVNIVSPEPVSLSEAYAAFYAALHTMGLTIEPAGDYYKIVELSGEAGRDLPVYGPGAKVPADDRMATQVIRPPAGQLSDTVSLLEALKTGNGKIQAVGTAVIVTDTGHRLRQMLELVEQIETPPEAQQRVYLYGIQNADAETLVEVVRSVFASSTTTGPTPTRPARKPTKGATASKPTSTVTTPSSVDPAIHVDVRTGTLVIVATPGQYAPIRRLIRELDVPQPGGHGTLHVIELRHADAAEVKEVLTGVAAKNDKDGAAGGRVAEVGTAVAGDIEVTAHVATQTLVVRATASDFEAVRKVVDAIDRPQRQLYIELYLLEVRADDLTDIGVGGHGTGSNAAGTGIVSSAPGGTTALGLATDDAASSLLGGLTAAFIGPELAGYDIPAFGVMLQALETREDVNVIARPHMYAAENQEAMVDFGENVPMNGGQTVLPNSGGATQFNVERVPVGLSIKIVPKVNDDEMITMDVTLEDNQLGALEKELNAYRSSQRKLDLKKVIAHPGQPVVLGGLVKESDKISDSQVPGLGRIPVLGWLFRSRKRDKEKVTLLMVMVPHLIDSPEDARRIHAERLQERMDFIQQYTAFKRRDLDSHINYRKKSGLLASVNAAARTQATEASRLDQARRELERAPVDTSISLGP
jgi:general secretion pathway protein D